MGVSSVKIESSTMWTNLQKQSRRSTVPELEKLFSERIR